MSELQEPSVVTTVAAPSAPPALSNGTPPRDAPAAPPRNGRKRKVASITIFLAVVLALAGVGAWYYLANLGYESTDDAFIAGNIYRIAPKIPGRIAEVPVNDNTFVRKGAILARIERADYETNVAQTRAQLELARAQQTQAEVNLSLVDASTAAAVTTAQAEVSAAQAQLEQARAELDSSRAELQRADADLERYSNLSAHAVTQQQLDVVRTAARNAASEVRADEKRVAAAEAEVAAAQSRLNAARAERKQVEAAQAEVASREAEVRRVQAALEQAELQLSYTDIIAPADGRVTLKSIMPGDYADAGQELMALVSPDTWVVANFKETQLQNIRPGQPARIHVDAYDVDLEGEVESIQAGSGAQFSLLPPQNATGNYVKIVQRVPVKIVFTRPSSAGEYLLGPGMSVVPRVKTK